MTAARGNSGTATRAARTAAAVLLAAADARARECALQQLRTSSRFPNSGGSAPQRLYKIAASRDGSGASAAAPQTAAAAARKQQRLKQPRSRCQWQQLRVPGAGAGTAIELQDRSVRRLRQVGHRRAHGKVRLASHRLAWDEPGRAARVPKQQRHLWRHA